MCALAMASWARPAVAQVYAEELRITGLWPDVTVTGGGGIGVGHALGSNFMARLRLGALYAYEPIVVSLGVSGQVGALAKEGIGGEFELDHFGGSWLQLGFHRVRGDDWMSAITLGLTVFGVEWQHRFDSPRDNAVLFVLRLPVGLWWFLLDHEDRERERMQMKAPAAHRGRER